MNIDGIKFLEKMKQTELETLIQTIRIYSQDVGMEFAIDKRDKLIMKSGKREVIEGIKLPNEEWFRTLREKENYNYLGEKSDQMGITEETEFWLYN